MIGSDIERRTGHGITMILFSPRRLRVVVPGEGSGVGIPTDPAHALGLLPSATAALNGPMFESTGSYTTYRQGTLEYLHYDLAGNENHPSRHPSWGATISVTDAGQAQASPGGALPANARVAVQGYPRLVSDGAKMSTSPHDQGAVWRPAIGIHRDGRIVLAIGHLGMDALAAALVAEGVVDAVYTDGGGSGHLIQRGHSTVGAGEARRVPSWLLVVGDGGVQDSVPAGVPAAVVAVVVLGVVGAVSYGATALLRA